MTTTAWIILGLSWALPWIWLWVGHRNGWYYLDVVLGGFCTFAGYLIAMIWFTNPEVDYHTASIIGTLALTLLNICLMCFISALCSSFCVEDELFKAGVIFIFLAAIVGFVWLMVSSETSKEIYQRKIEIHEIMENEPDIPIYGTSSDMMVSGWVRGGHFVVSGSVNSTPVYKYRFRNEYGALVTDYVPSDRKVSMIFDTLAEGEQPFMRIIHTYKIHTDYNVDPPTEEKVYACTNYHFFVPENSVGEDLEF